MTSAADLLDLDGRRAIVTGGAMGIGLGIARRLGEAGASVVIADVDGAVANQAAKALRDGGLTVEAVPADVSDLDSVRQTIDTAVRAFGGVDVLVNNAGIYPNLPLAELEPAMFDRVVAVNLRGVYLFTKYVAEQMKAQGGGGCIVNVTSIDAVHPSMVGLATYDATKHGVWGFTKSTALELAPFGIRVNAIAPGGIDTPGVQRMNADTASGADIQARMQQFLARIPMGRMGEPDDIGKVVLFLASDMAAYMTGSQLVVDGGALVA